MRSYVTLPSLCISSRGEGGDVMDQEALAMSVADSAKDRIRTRTRARSFGERYGCTELAVTARLE